MKPNQKIDKIEEPKEEAGKALDKGQEESENEASDSEKSIFRYFNFIKSKIFQRSVAAFLMLIVTIATIPAFFNSSGLKFKIEQKVSEISGATLTINSDVKISFLPYPALSAHGFLLQNYKRDGKTYNFYAKSVEIKLSFLKFLSGNFLIKRISFDDVILENFYDSNSTQTRQNKFSEIAAKALKSQSAATPEKKSDSDSSSAIFSVEKFNSAQFGASNIPKIKIENGTIISYDKLSRKREIEGISGEIMANSKKIYAEGTFINEKVSNDFELTAYFNSDAEKQNSILNISSPAMNLKVQGSFTGDNLGIINSDFIGKVEGEIFDLRAFYKIYVSGNLAIYEKLKPGAKSIKFSSDIKNTAGEIDVSNLIINSNLINGTGSAAIDLSSDIARFDVNLDLENLDLDSIWSNERINVLGTNSNKNLSLNSDETIETLSKNTKKKTPETGKDPEKLNLEIAKAIKNFDLSSEIKIKSVKYLEGEIKDVDLYLTVSKEGQILILPMIFKIPGDGMLRINGALDNDDDLPKFIGKVDITGKKLNEVFKWLKIQSQNLKFDNLKEYILYSDVMLMPNKIMLNNFYLSLNKGQSEFLGEIKIDSSLKTTNITNRFQVSTFNIDDYFLTSGQNIYLSAGSLLRKLLWLNDIPSANDVTLNFDKLIYKGEEFSDSAILKMRFGQGYLEISDLRLSSDLSDLKATLSIDISETNPKFEMNMVSNNFHYESPQNTKPENSAQNQVKAEIKKDIRADNYKNNVFDQFFALPSLEGFNGQINLILTNVKVDEVIIKNAKLNSKLQDGIMTDATAACDLYGGTFGYKGLIGIKGNKIINGNMTLTNAALEQLLPDLLGIKNIAGIANISANITSVADSRASFVKDIVSEIKFNANAPTIAGYGLSDLVTKITYLSNYRQELQDSEKILFNPAGKSTFKQASGTIVFKKNQVGKFSIKLAAPALNGVFSGKFNLENKSIDALANVIFVTGTKQKQVPLNIATAIKGNINNVSYNNNLDQVKQYLGIIKAKPAPNSNVVSTPAPNNASILIAPTSTTNPVTNSVAEDANKQIKAAVTNPQTYLNKQ
jgi:hypothetical protein